MTTSSSSSRPARLASGLLPLIALFAFAGCVGGGNAHYAGRTTVVVASDDYIYYPDSEVYYSNTRHTYIYRDGSRWITRSAPPRVWVRTAPSVHIDFHDAPERHHADIVRSYPRNWRPAPPPGVPAHVENKRGDKDGRRDNDKREDKDREDHHQ